MCAFPTLVGAPKCPLSLGEGVAPGERPLGYAHRCQGEQVILRRRQAARAKLGFGSYLAVPLTSGGRLLRGVKLKKHDQELPSGSKVGLLQESGRTPRRPRAAGCSQELTLMLQLTALGETPSDGHAEPGRQVGETCSNSGSSIAAAIEHGAPAAVV
jgi:hypothetical protein